jgi:UDPglucose 6-dehydrogenase
MDGIKRMDTKKTIGVVGGGFVGGTCYKVFSKLEGYDVRLYDKDLTRTKNTLKEVAECDVIFVAVPTPMDVSTGQCHTNIVERVIADLRNLNTESYIVIKSTVPPGTTENLNFSYGKIWFSPEFLTEARPYEDFVSLPYQILGIPTKEEFEKNPGNQVFEAFQEANRQGIIISDHLHVCNSRIAEMVKYTRNTYLATRLSFFNEIKQICDALDVDFDFMKNLAGLDPRVGHHYNKVEDGNEGFGGHCLPKDLNALRYIALKNGVDTDVLNGIWNKNLKVRKVRDWEQMEGRAVIKKEDTK